MNVIGEINQELNQLHLTEREKLRYVYKRICDIFSFDHRWFYTDTFHDYKLAHYIEHRKIDLENVTDFNVVCHSVAREVVKPLVNELTSFDATTVREKCHTYTVVKEPSGVSWTLDPITWDMPRAKLNITPLGMTSASIKPTDIDDMDIDIGFCFKTTDEYIRLINGKTFPDIIRNIGKVLDTTKVKYNYSDTRFFMKLYSYMVLCDTETYLNDKYEFHRLMNLCDEDAYFDVCKEDDCYKLKEINEEEYNHLVKTLRCK